MLRELSLEVLEPGVAGVPFPWRKDSGLFRSLLIPSKSPKLLRPVDVDARGKGGASRSSVDSRPKELIVDDLSLRFIRDLVGDEVPLFLEFGRNKAVAGDAFGFWNTALAGDAPGGVVTPVPLSELRAVGACCRPLPEAADEVLTRTGVEGVCDLFEAVLCSLLRFFWRCAIGNIGSGCLGRLFGSRKKLFVFEALCLLVGVLPRR